MSKLSQFIAYTFNRNFFLRNQPLSWKLFIYSAVLIIVPMIVVGVISYERSSAVLEEQAKRHNLQAIEQVETHIEYYMRDFEVSTLKILNHPDMQRFLRMRTAEEVEQSRIHSEIQDLIRAETYSRPDISYITVMLDNVRIIDSIGLRGRYPAAQLKDEYWYSSVPFNGLPLLISRSIQWEDRKEPVISVVRRIQSPRTLLSVGMLIIDVNFRRLQEVSAKFNDGARYFYILDSNGHYVYHPDIEKIGQRTEKPGLDIILSQKVGTLVSGSHNPEFLTYSHSPNLGWTFVTSIPYHELRSEAGRIGEIIIWTVLMALAAAYVFGVGIASTIIAPIRRLQKFMKRVEVGDFSETVKVESKDEIGQLSQGFNKMVTRLAALVEEVYLSKLKETEASLRQKEMEVKVLQSHINPHFLCNSLETIRGMALIKGNENIATMAASLGAVLGYNLRNTAPTVTVKEEINFCKMYLQIQQYRFEESFQYEVDMPDWAMGLSIVKFSLQPLVENCLQHNERASGEPTFIRISADKLSNTEFTICVSDTGAGIPEDVLAQLRLDLTEKDITSGGDSLGIVNVHRRIAHLFGVDYGVTIESTVGQGTKVIITLPIIEHLYDGGTGHE